MRLKNLTWYETYPKNINKNDLIGKKLKLDAARPPENTDKEFLKSLYVIDMETNQEYVVRVTLTDIQNAIDAIPQLFTFQKKKPDDAWANVVPVIDSPTVTEK